MLYPSLHESFMVVLYARLKLEDIFTLLGSSSGGQKSCLAAEAGQTHIANVYEVWYFSLVSHLYFLYTDHVRTRKRGTF